MQIRKWENVRERRRWVRRERIWIKESPSGDSLKRSGERILERAYGVIRVRSAVSVVAAAAVVVVTEHQKVEPIVFEWHLIVPVYEGSWRRRRNERVWEVRKAVGKRRFAKNGRAHRVCPQCLRWTTAVSHHLFLMLWKRKVRTNMLIVRVTRTEPWRQ